MGTVRKLRLCKLIIPKLEKTIVLKKDLVYSKFEEKFKIPYYLTISSGFLIQNYKISYPKQDLACFKPEFKK